MNNDPLYAFRMVASMVFIVTLCAGVYLARNHSRLVPVNTDMGSENSSDRLYAKFLVFAVWAHAAVLSGAFALLLH